MSLGRRKWVDLSLNVTPDVPKVSVLPCPTFERLSERSETSLQTTEVTIATHIGTHFDAPSHSVAGGRSIDDFDASVFVSSGVVCELDVGPCEPIGVEDVAHLEAEIDRSEALLLRTGWEDHVDSPDYHQHPYLETDLAEWLTRRDLDWIGIDFLTPDMPGELRPNRFTFPVHTTLLGDEVLIAENLTNLGTLTSRTVDVLALPLKLAGLDGAPARIIAAPQIAGDG